MLGVCWYPEQWPATMWASDAQRMRSAGIEFVRIGEFAWSRLQPSVGNYAWDWLDEAFDVLESHGLRIVLGTPTAAPPKWLVDAHPEILPIDSLRRVRRFGARRHYCFSSPAYRARTREIVTALANRYGSRVAGWQVDNEYGCHDTARCWCPRCATAFRRWLQNRYQTISALNEAHGNAFWSQDYGGFDAIEPPIPEGNPALLLDFYRFSSDQIVDYNRMQCDILRPGGKFTTHNFMACFTDLDALRTGEDLDFASWDNYPLGDVPERWARTGHPDFAAFHHDLYRRVGRGRFWVMEQQPGPINWGEYNPVPAPGMVRLWTWEAFAHGAEVVSYFRWRQAARAQEQMHAGLLRADNVPADGMAEAWRVAREMAFVNLPDTNRAPIALVFDYEAAWIFELQPHGRGFEYLPLVMIFYESIRRLGLDVDIVAPGDDLSPYRVVLAPSLPIWRNPQWKGALVVGPRTATKTEQFAINTAGIGEGRARVHSVRAETLPPSLAPGVTWEGRRYVVGGWRERLETDAIPTARFDDGESAVVELQGLHWLAFWPTVEFLMDYLENLCRAQGIGTVRLSETLRLRRRGDLTFAFNYGPDLATPPAPADASFLLGSRDVAGWSVTAWRCEHPTIQNTHEKDSNPVVG